MKRRKEQPRSGLNSQGLIFLFWFLYGLFESVKTGVWTSGWSYVFFYFIPGIIIWIMLTFPTRWIFQRSQHLSLITRIPLLIFVAVLVAAIKFSLAKLIAYIIMEEGDHTFVQQLSRSFRFLFTEALIVSTILMTVLFILEIYSKYKNESLMNARLEGELNKAQLQALKMQLQPHFLFNVLNTVSNLIRVDKNETAINILSNLSELLRYSFNSTQAAIHSLDLELKFLKQYLDLEKIRFQDQLSLSYQIEESAGKARVPQMILQPIVENAIKHGISQHLGPATIHFEARVEKGDLLICVNNTGPKYEATSWGVGLTNTRERLGMMYGNDRLEIQNTSNGVVVTIRLPYETVDPM